MLLVSSEAYAVLMFSGCTGSDKWMRWMSVKVEGKTASRECPVTERFPSAAEWYDHLYNIHPAVLTLESVVGTKRKGSMGRAPAFAAFSLFLWYGW